MEPSRIVANGGFERPAALLRVREGDAGVGEAKVGSREHQDVARVSVGGLSKCWP